jgi:3-dehydroquinate synthase
MTNKTETIQVGIKGKTYPIYIGEHLKEKVRASVQALLASKRKVCVITDENVAKSQADFMLEVFEGAKQFVLPSGETTKSLEHLGSLYDFLCENEMDRKAVLFAFGGGVIGDLTGFAAASYLRGIDFYQVPTTLLAMVDSSVGGKTGINIKGGKNLVGAFYQPEAVFIDTDLLQTLPSREFSAGMAEAIKTGLLGDAKLYEKICGVERLDASHPDLRKVILSCCQLKAKVVEADEKELESSGGRALLNLGHTFGHAIEAVTGYGTYLHGEAVAIGLNLALELSIACDYKVENLRESLPALLKKYELPLTLTKSIDLDALVKSMYHDKKARNGKLRFVLLKDLGNAITQDGISEDLVRKIWKIAFVKA